MPVGWRYVGKRVFLTIPVVLAVTLITYLLSVSSGNHFWDVLRSLQQAGYQLTPQQVQQMQQYYHLNQPALEGYFLWLSQVVRGDLGLSVTGLPVTTVVLPMIIPTLELQVPAILLSAGLGLVIGTFSAARRTSKSDSLISSAAVVAVAVPAFWLSTISITVFSLYLHLLPSYGMLSGYPPYWWGSPPLDQFAHFVLPFAILVTASTPLYIRLARARATETLAQDWVKSIKASPVGNFSLLYRHVLRNAMGPVLAVFAINLGVSLSLSPGIEYAFSWPGLGLGLVNAILKYDQSVIIAIILIVTTITLVASILADVAYSAVDPRVVLE